MRSKLKTILLLSSISILAFTLLSNCDDELSGPEKPINAPVTELLNIPVPNSIDDPYEPMLKVGWKGISEGSTIKGFWISWKSEYLFMNETVEQEPYFTDQVSLVIPFPSADSLNKQILYVRAEDKLGNIDPVGDSVVFYTTRTFPPQTNIVFPPNDNAAFYLDKSTVTWKGVLIVAEGTSKSGAIKDYSVRIDNGGWSEWQEDSTFYLTPGSIDGLTNGKHTVSIKSRNVALVEDASPAQITVNFVDPTHQKEWLIIDDTKDQNGTVERPDDAQVDEFYAELLANESFDTWDLTNDGALSKELLGQYKYLLWHCDDHRQTNLPLYAGVLSDYLNTKGRMILSGWSYVSYFGSEGEWRDSIQYYGNFLRDYLHINNYRIIEDALLHSSIIVEEDYSVSGFAAVDTNKIWSFRNGLFKVTDFRINELKDLPPFTDVLFAYWPSDTTNNDFMRNTIGIGYHNSEYQLVTLGFPIYYFEKGAARIIFDRASAYLKKEFPY